MAQLHRQWRPSPNPRPAPATSRTGSLCEPDTALSPCCPQTRPTPPHLTSAMAENILAAACESETRKAAKRMRLEIYQSSQVPAHRRPRSRGCSQAGGHQPFQTLGPQVQRDQGEKSPRGRWSSREGSSDGRHGEEPGHQGPADPGLHPEPEGPGSIFNGVETDPICPTERCTERGGPGQDGQREGAVLQDTALGSRNSGATVLSTLSRDSSQGLLPLWLPSASLPSAGRAHSPGQAALPGLLSHHPLHLLTASLLLLPGPRVCQWRPQLQLPRLWGLGQQPAAPCLPANRKSQ